jgi:hypothetical protein
MVSPPDGRSFGHTFGFLLRQPSPLVADANVGEQHAEAEVRLVDHRLRPVIYVAAER